MTQFFEQWSQELMITEEESWTREVVWTKGYATLRKKKKKKKKKEAGEEEGGGRRVRDLEFFSWRGYDRDGRMDLTRACGV